MKNVEKKFCIVELHQDGWWMCFANGATWDQRYAHKRSAVKAARRHGFTVYVLDDNQLVPVKKTVVRPEEPKADASFKGEYLVDEAG